MSSAPDLATGIGPDADLDVDALLADCATEPIHAPGAIQPHGALLGVDGHGTVVLASENTSALLGVEPGGLLGRPLSTVWPGWDEAGPDLAHRGRGRGVVAGVPVDVTHVAGEPALLELEPVVDPGPEAQWELQEALRDFHDAGTVDQLLAQAVAAVATLSGYDRVMAYRFDEEWNGEVVQEAIRDGAESFLGLRFPASDIPPQARALYARARVRVIPDATAVPSPLRVVDRDGRDVDLSDVSLRAVSPVHLEYLRNMGVAASMSAALTVRGELWGLIACHHTTGPRPVPPWLRTSFDLVARVTSSMLTVLVDAESAAQGFSGMSSVGEVASRIRAAETSFDDLLDRHAEDLLGLVDAGAVATLDHGVVHMAGTFPPQARVRDLVERAVADGRTEVVTAELQATDPAWAEHAGTAAGAIALQLGPFVDRWVVWFRPETAATVRWGGDPGTSVAAVDATGRARLHPRASFAEYVEQVRGRARRWTAEELVVARTIVRRLADDHAAQSERRAREVARLQQTLMVDASPSIDGFDLATHFRPSSQEPLGGDWFDVFHRRDGRSVIAVGDVAGHGFDAAGTMAQLRHALRAYLLREPDLPRALTRLNELTRVLLPRDMATLVLVEVEPGSPTVYVSSAGHHPPLVSGPAGIRWVDANGPALGLGPRREYPMVPVELGPDDTVICYSDGLIERRERTIEDGMQRLADAAQEVVSANAARHVDHLLAALVDDDPTDDDLTVVVVRPR